MKLEDIGFYTLSDRRAEKSNAKSPLWRCELILTDICNFKCPYCRGVNPELQGSMPIEKAKEVLGYWIDDGLKNVRFSGGEPTLYKDLPYLVSLCKHNGVERIAVSTNGSAPTQQYLDLIALGVNDFSISLDSGCCSVGDKMAGNKLGAWNKTINNIRELSKLTYVTVGMVFTDENIETCKRDVLFADSLGVSDIRVIPAAQFDKALKELATLPEEILGKYPILNYRINNIRKGRHVRGLEASDAHKCHLVLDDMAVVAGYHFPCIIYLREGGEPIGKVGPHMREDRQVWMDSHDTHDDPICKAMCLDVCKDYCNKAKSFKRLLKPTPAL